MSSRTKINRKTILKLVGNRRKPIPGTCPEEWTKEINARIGAGPQAYTTTLVLVNEMLEKEQIVFAKAGNGKLRLRPASEVSRAKRASYKARRREKRESIRLGDVPVIVQAAPVPQPRSLFERINARFEQDLAAAEADLRQWAEQSLGQQSAA
jgi:hypothetical protein